jgi:hypothetical protein
MYILQSLFTAGWAFGFSIQQIKIQRTIALPAMNMLF